MANKVKKPNLVGTSKKKKESSEIIDKEVTGKTPNNIFMENADKLKNLTSLKNLKPIKDNDLSLFLSSSYDHKALLISQWQDEKKLTKAGAQSLHNIVELLRVTRSNADMVEVLSKEGINKSLDLVMYNKDSLAEIMKKGKIKAPDSKDINTYVGEVLSIAEGRQMGSNLQNTLYKEKK